MAPPLEKDRELLHLIERLRADLGADAFAIVDHWEADLCAIGLGMPTDQQTLVYVSTYNLPRGQYYFELESPPASDEESYSNSGSAPNCTYQELLEIIKSHLNTGT